MATTITTTTTKDLTWMMVQIWWLMQIPGQGGPGQMEIIEVMITEVTTMKTTTMVGIVDPHVLQVTLIQ